MDLIGLRDLATMSGLDGESQVDRQRLRAWLSRNQVPYVSIGRSGQGRSSGALISTVALVAAVERASAVRADRRRRRRLQQPRML
ncbi:MAG: hypothetical protein GEU28_10545 [Dehalococcoidia bacterium]|nr:hypothetical protein [Dehalococcoidia bacterium]